ncbi:MAG: hypothetical protein A3E25_07775 [Burkholderiales bacterium RIFCSPHIGHO2_12_FULL_69_20]|nr:MAG: hypothetical protein A3E25_07775 [Burkholderiales bacterium RIFCSPHIGHO2_12_FULL_69_20]
MQRELLLPDEQAPDFQPLEVARFLADATARHYLGRLAEVDCWAVSLPAPPPGWQPRPLRSAMQSLVPVLGALAGRAAQALEWDRSHRFCGVCGTPTALAGFVEAGESLEDCVHREVAEEVAVTVQDLRYYGSQSWPFPHSLMVAFTARWVGGEIVPQPGEIEHAQWFAIDALPGIPPRFSIAGHLIRDTVAAMQAGGWG